MRFARGTFDAGQCKMLSRTLALLAVAAGCLVSASCARPSSTTQTTSAQKYVAGSPDLRTVDNAGFVDPVGRTSQVTTGGSITERGTGVAPTRREETKTTGPGAGEPQAAAEGPPVASSSADPSELTERAARALCDREAFCEHIGSGKTFESADACMSSKRERVRQAVAERGCRDIRGEAVSRCLNAIRGAECGTAGAPLPPPRACDADALCK
jgi:hypothetical protein